MEMVNWYKVLRHIPILPHEELSQEDRDEARRAERKWEDEEDQKQQELDDERFYEMAREQSLDAIA